MLLRAFARLLDALGILVGLTLGAIALLICLDIFVRNGADLFNWLGITKGMKPSALPWVTELTEYLMYGAAFIGAPWALRKGAHVRVDVFISGLPRLPALILDYFVDLIGFAISVVLMIYGYEAVVDAWVSDLVARKTWNFDEWILLLPIPISGLLLSIEFVLRFFRLTGVPRESADVTQKTSI
ncbi:MAG: TRAP transporter small permease [Rhodospirillaceae bacterium]|nr:TRAP transporter small permease [Rhodospirillaceae bacterium]